MSTTGSWQLLALSAVLVTAIAVTYGAQGTREKGERQLEHDHGTAHAGNQQAGASRPSIPRPLTVEHQELHEELLKGTKEPGDVGEAAKAVAELLHPHFVKEEEYALPPLGLLASLAQGKVTPEMASAIPMADKLKAELAHMLQEHRSIVAALETLAEAATKAGKSQYARFAEKLKLHAQTEEQVLYPAAILVGEYLKLKRSG